ncbi:hypothetical protein HZS_7644 [Henneguya salminicola]|nr:hypothetical protein HZS_7644 [Henneguya salminicola]
MTSIIRVVVTGAAGQIGYSILPKIALGLAFGHKQPIHLVLFDLPVCENVMKGVQIELEDLASPVLMGTSIATTGEEAFKHADFIICLAGALALGEGMTRAMLTSKNKPIYESHGKLIDEHAKKTCKILVVANPCNTMCLILSKSAPSIPVENFSSMSRLDHNRTRSMIAKELSISTEQVKGVCVWGNHASSMVPDVSFSTVVINSKTQKVHDAIKSSEFWSGFEKNIQERAMLVVKYRQKTSALSSANAAVDHLRDWFCGTPEGQFSSMGVWSDGSYQSPKGVFFSFPCVCKNGTWTIVKDLAVSKEIQAKLKITGEDLIQEKTEIGF